MSLKLQVGENRVGITFESLMWFLVFTAIGTVLGMIAYEYVPQSWKTVAGNKPPAGT